MKKNILITIVFILMIFVSVGLCADYYVSPTGSGSDCTLVNPCEWGTGLTKPVAGDTVYARHGTYNITGGNYDANRPSNSGSSASIPITFMPYPGESATLEGGVCPTGTVFSFYQRNYIVLDGFTIHGQISLRTTTGSIIQNCDISIGGDEWSGYNFGDVIYTEGDTNCIIKNNRIHDNCINASDRGNSPLVMSYGSTNLTIENNDIYNSVGHGIYLKSDPNNPTVKLNYIYDNYYSGLATAIQHSAHTGGDVYQNIFRANNSGNNDDYGGNVGFINYMTGMNFYNNTLVNGTAAGVKLNYTGTATYNVFNNLFYASVGYHILIHYSGVLSSLSYLDYNGYYGGATFYDDDRTPSAMSFANWQTYTETEQNSVIIDPGFANATGTTAADFKRSSYAANGRGGAYPSVMGAYITGTECIGYGCATSGSSITSISITGGAIY